MNAPTTAASTWTPAGMQAVLAGWQAAGWLRPLDAAFAGFVAEHGRAEAHADAEAPAAWMLAAALLAHMEGHGHTCLALDELGRGGPALTDAAWAEALAAVLHDGPRDAATWVEVLAACPAVARGGEPAGAPLVLDGTRLYLRRHWRDETDLAGALQARCATASTTRDAGLLWGRAEVDALAVRGWLDRLFGPPSSDPVDWQRLACAAALRGRLTVITGGPGTGKTFTAARLLALLLATAAQPQALRIGLAAPTGKAAARLEQAIAAAWVDLAATLGADLPLAEWAASFGRARTLHAWLGARPDTRRWRHDAHQPLALDVLLVDEASMVHQELMAALLRALPPTTLLVLLGDKDQLASVEAGAVLGELCRDAAAGGYTAATAADLARLTGRAVPAAFIGAGPALAQQTVMLRESRRFSGAIGRLALAVRDGEAAPALAQLQGAAPGSGLVLMQAAGQGSLIEGDAPAGDLHGRLVALALAGTVGDDGAPLAGYRAVFQGVRAGLRAGWADAPAHAAWVRSLLQAFEQTRLLCALREGRWGAAGLNEALHAALAAERLVQADAALGSGWYAGRPVMVTRNDPSLGVFNGDVGLALPAPGGALKVWFLDGDSLRSVLASRLSAVDTAFAMTVHKSQGSEFAHTLLVLPERDSPVASRELLYTGITRARRALTVVLPEPAVWPTAVARVTRRASGLGAALRGPGGVGEAEC